MLAARQSVGADIIDGVAGLVSDELEAPQIDPVTFRVGDEFPGRAGEVTRHAAVARRNLAKIIGTDEAAGAVLVLDHDEWLALDMPAEIFRQEAALDVGGSTRREVDQERQALALVERIGGECGGRTRERAEPDQ